MREPRTSESIAKFACIVASSLEVAIIECRSGAVDHCVETLESLKHLCSDASEPPGPENNADIGDGHTILSRVCPG